MLSMAKDCNLAPLVEAAMRLALAREMDADGFARALRVSEASPACKQQERIDSAASRLERAGVAVTRVDANGRMVHIRSTVYV